MPCIHSSRKKEPTHSMYISVLSMCMYRGREFWSVDLYEPVLSYRDRQFLSTIASPAQARAISLNVEIEDPPKAMKTSIWKATSLGRCVYEARSPYTLPLNTKCIPILSNNVQHPFTTKIISALLNLRASQFQWLRFMEERLFFCENYFPAYYQITKKKFVVFKERQVLESRRSLCDIREKQES